MHKIASSIEMPSTLVAIICGITCNYKLSVWSCPHQYSLIIGSPIEQAVMPLQ